MRQEQACRNSHRTSRERDSPIPPQEQPGNTVLACDISEVQWSRSYREEVRESISVLTIPLTPPIWPPSILQVQQKMETKASLSTDGKNSEPGGCLAVLDLREGWERGLWTQPTLVPPGQLTGNWSWPLTASGILFCSVWLLSMETLLRTNRKEHFSTSAPVQASSLLHHQRLLSLASNLSFPSAQVEREIGSNFTAGEHA